MNFALFTSRPAIDWVELFGNPNPVEMEIGSGKGAFLLESAIARPDTNFLGLENQPRWVRFVESRLERAARPNVRIVRADAAMVIARFVRDESVRAFHVYFPDPWWKRRHRKRRVVRHELAAHLLRTLEPRGRLFVTTDVENRFREMLDVLSSAGFEAVTDRAGEPCPMTNFERKYRREGRPIHSTILAKPAR